MAVALASLLLGANLASPLYAVYRDRFGFNGLVLTLVFAVYALVLAPSLLIFGELSDRIGRRPVILGGLAMGTIALGLFALASGVAWLFAARIAQGLSVGMAGGAATAALVELDPRDDRGHAALLATLAQTAGSAAGPLLTGVLAQWLPAPRVLSYLVGMVFCVALALLVLAMPEPGKPRGGSWNVPRPSVPKDIRRAFARVAATGAAVWSVAALFFSVVPSFATEKIGISNLAVLGAVSAIVLICSSLAQLVSRGRIDPRVAQALGLGILTAGLAALVLASADGQRRRPRRRQRARRHGARLRLPRRAGRPQPDRSAGAARRDQRRALHVRVSRRRAARDRGGRALRLHDPDDRGRRRSRS